MNELIINANSNITVVGDAGSVAGIIAEFGGIEVTRDELKTHPLRLPRARVERMAQLFGPNRDGGLRDAKLIDLDREANHAITGRPNRRAVAAIEADRAILRNLPPQVEAHLATLASTDDIKSYLPVELNV